MAFLHMWSVFVIKVNLSSKTPTGLWAFHTTTRQLTASSCHFDEGRAAEGREGFNHSSRTVKQLPPT